ncbi:MAG TPA: hypothetical protein VHZ74_16680 [Bryobacteraceae bacterium]|nr:hypothetical protein [Bryobacteraceae bacterium]
MIIDSSDLSTRQALYGRIESYGKCVRHRLTEQGQRPRFVEGSKYIAGGMDGLDIVFGQRTGTEVLEVKGCDRLGATSDTGREDVAVFDPIFI